MTGRDSPLNRYLQLKSCADLKSKPMSPSTGICLSLQLRGSLNFTDKLSETLFHTYPLKTYLTDILSLSPGAASSWACGTHTRRLATSWARSSPACSSRRRGACPSSCRASSSPPRASCASSSWSRNPKTSTAVLLSIIVLPMWSTVPSTPRRRRSPLGTRRPSASGERSVYPEWWSFRCVCSLPSWSATRSSTGFRSTSPTSGYSVAACQPSYCVCLTYIRRHHGGPRVRLHGWESHHVLCHAARRRAHAFPLQPHRTTQHWHNNWHALGLWRPGQWALRPHHHCSFCRPGHTRESERKLQGVVHSDGHHRRDRISGGCVGPSLRRGDFAIGLEQRLLHAHLCRRACLSVFVQAGLQGSSRLVWTNPPSQRVQGNLKGGTAMMTTMKTTATTPQHVTPSPSLTDCSAIEALK
ncbi:glucose-6-phosphate exchanger SLC37A2 isoform X4 [Phyllopteryx taeniolatus]|uniref:glucose-6-phosphate exchanger SLC37A2 isoform X4 n=1 Tax=Phyllopteryx taeniolatus TaxID=161469 RepID=UPI002AD43C42|nr:glucose-6-phosphate exchanger SLC37A2 isoform X4 [Phyllopteryx taeniolatus]